MQITEYAQPVESEKVKKEMHSFKHYAKAKLTSQQLSQGPNNLTKQSSFSLFTADSAEMLHKKPKKFRSSADKTSIPDLEEITPSDLKLRTSEGWTEAPDKVPEKTNNASLRRVCVGNVWTHWYKQQLLCLGGLPSKLSEPTTRMTLVCRSHICHQAVGEKPYQQTNIYTVFFFVVSYPSIKNFRTCFWGHGWVNKKGIQTRTGPEGWPPPPRRCCCPLPAPWGALPPAAGWCSWWSPGSRWAPPPRWTGWSLAGWRTGGWPVRWRRISSDGWNDSDEDEGGCSHLDDLQVLFAALCCQALHTAELAARCVRVMDGAADELSRVQRPRHSLDLQRLPQRVAVAGGVHHHGLGAGVDFCFHHGDFQDVRHRRLLSGRPGARLGEQLGGGLCAAERWRWTVGAAKGDLGDGGTLRDDWLRWRRFLLHELSHNYTSKHFKMTAEHLLEELNSSK